MKEEAGVNEEREILLRCLRLKRVVRAGWTRFPIGNPESVAAHCWGMGLLALLTCPPELDREKVITLALIHDLAEVIVGDITPLDGVPKDEKRKINTIGDLNNIVKMTLRSSEKTLLIAIYNNQNQRRYIGVKLN